MSNLPNAPLDNVPDDNTDDNTISVRPGSAFEKGFVPKAPEKPEIPAILASPETQPAPEIQPVPQSPLYNEPKNEQLPSEPAPIPTPPPTQSVVDKTEQITSLHEIKSTEDELTKEADEEEEHFIEEVEKQHGDL